MFALCDYVLYACIIFLYDSHVCILHEFFLFHFVLINYRLSVEKIDFNLIYKNSYPYYLTLSFIDEKVHKTPSRNCIQHLSASIGSTIR